LAGADFIKDFRDKKFTAVVKIMAELEHGE
jgi:hypothetical protein